MADAGGIRRAPGGDGVRLSVLALAGARPARGRAASSELDRPGILQRGHLAAPCDLSGGFDVTHDPIDHESPISP